MLRHLGFCVTPKAAKYEEGNHRQEVDYEELLGRSLIMLPYKRVEIKPSYDQQPRYDSHNVDDVEYADQVDEDGKGQGDHRNGDQGCAGHYQLFITGVEQCIVNGNEPGCQCSADFEQLLKYEQVMVSGGTLDS